MSHARTSYDAFCVTCPCMSWRKRAVPLLALFCFLLQFLVSELCRLWLKCVCKEKSRTSSNGVLSHLRSESVPVHVYRNFEFLPGTQVLPPRH